MKAYREWVAEKDQILQNAQKGQYKPPETGGKWKISTQRTANLGGDGMPGKITVRNYTTLTDYAALLRAGRYLAGFKKEAEGNGICFKVTESERHGVVVKITEVGT